MNFIYFIMVFGLLVSIINKNYLLAGIFAICLPLALLSIKLYKKNKIKRFEEKIKETKELEEKGQEYTPFINLNYEPWEIIQLIPNMDRLSAKKIANRARTKKFKTINEVIEFANLNAYTNKYLVKIAYV